MEQRISFVTLAVADLTASRRFYVDGLGWRPELEADGVVMLMAGPQLVLSLWDREEFEAEVGPIATPNGVPPFTLSHNVAAPADVDDVIAEAESAGATAVGHGQERAWGGYSGYFSDPDGIRWEIAHNPQGIGRKVLP